MTNRGVLPASLERGPQGECRRGSRRGCRLRCDRTSAWQRRYTSFGAIALARMRALSTRGRWGRGRCVAAWCDPLRVIGHRRRPYRLLGPMRVAPTGQRRDRLPPAARAARCHPRRGPAHWVTQGTPLPTRSVGTSESVSATSPQLIWASAGSGPLWATDTEGSNWAAQPVPSPVVQLAVNGRYLWALACASSSSVDCRLVLERERLLHGPWMRLRLPNLVSDPYPELVCAGFPGA
jgi:hypothetical protein